MGAEESRYADSPFCSSLVGSVWETRLAVPLWIFEDGETFPQLGRVSPVSGAIQTTLLAGAAFTITEITPQTLPKASYAPIVKGYVHSGWSLEGISKRREG